MEISQEDWDEWRNSNPVTREWFKMLRERQVEYEHRIPAHLASGSRESIEQARIASGRHQELEDLLNTEFEHMVEDMGSDTHVLPYWKKEAG